MEDFDRIRYLAVLNGLTPEACAERLAKGMPLEMKAAPPDLPMDWDDLPPFEAGPRWQRIEQFPDGYMG